MTTTSDDAESRDSVEHSADASEAAGGQQSELAGFVDKSPPADDDDEQTALDEFGVAGSRSDPSAADVNALRDDVDSNAESIAALSDLVERAIDEIGGLATDGAIGGSDHPPAESSEDVDLPWYQ